MPQKKPAIGEDVSSLFGGAPDIGADVSALFDAPAQTPYDPSKRAGGAYAKPVSAEDFTVQPSNGWPAKIGDAAGDLLSFARGGAKSAAHSALDLGQMAINAGMVPGQTPGLSNPLLDRAREDTAYREGDTAERIGAGTETAMELLAPGIKGTSAAIESIPSAGRAKQLFQGVKAAAKDIPVDMSAPGDVALRIADLAQRGGGTNFGPAPVRQFIQWATDPKRPPMTYEVARDFASNISRLSAKESMSIPPAMQREIHELRVVLNKAIGDAASKAGKGEDYARAMTEYAKAMKLRDAIDAAKEGAVKYLPKAAGAAGLGVAGAGGYELYKLLTGK